MQEQKAERGQDRSDRLAETAKQDEYRQELLKQRIQGMQNTKDAGAAKLAEALKKQASDSLHKTFDTVAKHVADGTVQPETANQILKSAVGSLPDTLKDDPIVQMVSDPAFQLVKPSKDIQPQAKQFGDTSVIYNPNTGAFHVEGPTKASKEATVDWPIGPEGSTGVPSGRIKGPVSDPSVRAMMGTNAPPLPTVQPPALPGQPAAAAPKVRKYNPDTGLIE